MNKALTPRPQMPMGALPAPFHERIAAENFQHSWMNWNGYASPGVLDTAEFEYFAIRNQSTLFDISPMCKFRIKGPDAEAVMNRMVTRDVRKQKPGRVSYVIWCDEDGNVVDDGTLFRRSEDEFLLFCQEPQLLWIKDIAWGFDVEVTEVTHDLAGFAFQGPTTAATLRDLKIKEIETMRPFDIRDIKIAGKKVMISRTGFTGDLGYELVMAPKDALSVWDAVYAAGQLRGVRIIGYEALEMARIEAGFLLPRVDFISSQTNLRVNRARNPFEIGLGWLVTFDKPHYNGKRALQRLAGMAPKRKLVAIEISKDKAAHHALVYHRKTREVGFVTSALWSATTKRNIAYAWLEVPFGQAVKDDLWVEIYLQREIEWQRRMERVMIVERPFFVHPRRTVTPPLNF
jgi:aminomethyltransferase